MTDEVNNKIETFFSDYKPIKFAKNTVLISSNANPANIIKLQKGQVRQYDISEQGDKIVVNVFKEPAFFPVSWAINKTPNKYFYETATDVVAKFAPTDSVVQFLKDNPDVVYDLLSRVFLGTDVLLRRMAHLMGGSARTRILYELLLEAKRFGIKQTSGDILIPIHLNELAARSGLARETASRELSKLKDFGILVNHQGIYISDLDVIINQLGDDL